jgi:photosystem II stability/assembly factor-like uncharacterized protein
MGQQVQLWRSQDGGRAWLSRLVATMERVASPEIRALYCDPSVLAGVTAQLARPASSYPYTVSEFSLRN